MTTLEAEVLEALRPNTRLLYPETIAAISQHPVTEVDQALVALGKRQLAYRNQCGQWRAAR